MVKVVEDYKPGVTACLMVYQHAFTDGIGVANSFIFFNDKEHRPKSLPGDGKDFPWYLYLFYSFLAPYSFLTSVHELYPHKSENIKKLKSLIGNSGMTTNLITKEYNFEDIRKCYKKYPGRTYNQFIMGVGSKALHKWFQQYNVNDVKGLVTIAPAAMKPFTADIDKLDLGNYTSGSTFNFPIRGDFEQAMEETTKGFHHYHTIRHLIYTVLMLNIFKLLPPFFGKLTYRTFCNSLDMTFTNVKGFSEPVYI